MPAPLAAFRGVYQAYPRGFWVLWVGTLINRLGEFVVPLLGFYLAAERGLGVAQVSVVLSVLGVGRFVAEAFGGRLSDRLGSNSVMVLALGGGAATLVALAFASSFGAVMLGVLAFSLLTGMYKPAASSAVAALTTGAQRTRAYNLLYWAINVGVSVAPALGGWLSGISFRLLFFLDAATMAAYAALLAVLGARVGGSRKGTDAPRTAWLPRDRLLWSFCLASLLFALTYQSYKLLALVFAEQGFTAAQYGQALSVNGLLVVGLGLPLGHAISKGNHPRWQAVGAALLGLGFLGHAFAHTFAAHVLAVAVWTLGEIVSYSIGKSIVAELGRPEVRGTYIGMVGSMSGLGALLAPLLGGFLLVRFGNAALWSVVAGLAFLAALLYLRLEGAVVTRRTLHGAQPAD
ncbi:MFS transporter [Deinococcus planocerae]|uniref:MFS transporter n=1 Tax=Deinococcus planocerae TaxID=1737569 RepID=UPI000C7E9050|nr:MFS transporter [Deinococcus planocerae]